MEATKRGLPARPAATPLKRAEMCAERARLRPKITADHKNYAGYQRKTDREIPVVVLRPVTD